MHGVGGLIRRRDRRAARQQICQQLEQHGWIDDTRAGWPRTTRAVLQAIAIPDKINPPAPRRYL
jgi:hypothetical protein